MAGRYIVGYDRKNQLPESVRKRRKEIKTTAKETLVGQRFHNDGFDKEFVISGRGIDEWLNQPHKHYEAKNEALLDLDGLFRSQDTLDLEKMQNRGLMSCTAIYLKLK